MRIRILYDNQALNKNFKAGWGFSCLVDEDVLLDAGEKGKPLLENMKAFKINPLSVKKIVISHNHRDHTGGLRALLEVNPGIEIYACEIFSQKLSEGEKIPQKNIRPVKGYARISASVFSSGEIEGVYKNSPITEQGLVLSSKSGNYLITGCAHPGIEKMAEQVIEQSGNKLKGVIGGFHLFKKSREESLKTAKKLKEMGIEKAGPSHCSGKEAQNIFREVFKKDFLEIKAGTEVSL